jgi:Ca2+-binding EF-hand superfamily protein
MISVQELEVVMRAMGLSATGKTEDVLALMAKIEPGHPTGQIGLTSFMELLALKQAESEATQADELAEVFNEALDTEHKGFFTLTDLKSFAA